jgi:putative transcriptional regulator
MSNISTITRTRSVYIIEGESKTTSVEHTVLIERKELDSLSDSEELDDLISERASTTVDY